MNTVEKDISCRSNREAQLLSEFMGTAQGAGDQPQHWPTCLDLGVVQEEIKCMLRLIMDIVIWPMKLNSYSSTG